MKGEKFRIYAIFGLLTSGSLIWLIWNFLLPGDTAFICMFHQATGLPCPSCGTTTSVLQILNGNFSDAFDKNILGFPAFIALIILTCWLGFDFISRRSTFFSAYQSSENWIKKHPVVLAMMLSCIAVNWIFLIAKHG
ncbi:MAG: DUF2752 domain-containing protein [Bacteroidia bacterium]|nr:DUF2752 domain-containing protein [Bacteroidia bacterium]